MISRVEEYRNGGIVLGIIDEDEGVLEAEMVTRLPRHIARDYSAAVLNIPPPSCSTPPGETTSASRNHLNTDTSFARVLLLDRHDHPFRKHKWPVPSQPPQTHQPSMSSGEEIITEDEDEQQLPLVLHRRHDTIPVVRGRARYDVRQGIIVGEQREMKRLGQAFEEGMERGVKRKKSPQE